jgi:ABC-2 type transport system permease protein
VPFSSVSVRQLLVSKVLALGIAGLLQVLLWLISMPLLVNLASSVLGGALSNVQIPSGFLVLGIVSFVLGYLLFAVLSIGIGAISPNAREGSQLSMIYTMASFIPLWLASLLIAFPSSPIWVVLSVLPITSPVQVMLRLGVSDIPVWQILISIGALVLPIAAGLFVSAKLFRVQMLMYGRRPRLAEIGRSLKNA